MIYSKSESTYLCFHNYLNAKIFKLKYLRNCKENSDEECLKIYSDEEEKIVSLIRINSLILITLKM